MRRALGSRLGLVASACFLASLLHAQFTYEPQQFNDMTAQLTVDVANQTATRGLGAATLTLTVTGPETLEVEEPHLGDAASAWKEDRLTSTKVIQNKRARWSQVIRLNQSKKGIETLPDVSLRLREGPAGEWEEAKWIDILKHLRGLPAPAQAMEPPSWLRRWGFALALAVTAVLVFLVWRKKRGWRDTRASLSPEQWALREIEHLEGSFLPPKAEAETYHTQLSFVIRRFLAERFGLHALQQTTAEFLESFRQVPRMTTAQQALASELLHRCDLAKFARVSTSAEECRRTAELARELIRQTNGTSLSDNDVGCEI